MTKRDWQRRLPDGVHLAGRDTSGFRLEVSLPAGDDGLWPMRCPEHPDDHIFKIQVTQSEDAGGSPLFCPYCGYRADTVWDFAPQQRKRLRMAARAAAEQYVADSMHDMLGKAFGGRRSSSRRSGISIEYRPGRAPARRSLPSYEVDETRRTMACQVCQETFAVYGLAIYCPNCGQLAPAQQFAELIRVHRERLAALDALADETKRPLTESGVLWATYESTIKDGFSALETYLKARFVAEAPNVSLTGKGKGAVFQRLDEVASLYREHLDVDPPRPTRLGRLGDVTDDRSHEARPRPQLRDHRRSVPQAATALATKRRAAPSNQTADRRGIPRPAGTPQRAHVRWIH